MVFFQEVLGVDHVLEALLGFETGGGQDLQQAHLRQPLVLAQELTHLGVDLSGRGAVFALIPAALEGWPVTLLR